MNYVLDMSDKRYIYENFIDYAIYKIKQLVIKV